MVQFTYNNVKNTSISHIFFELNCDYYPRASYEKDVNPYSQSKFANTIATELQKQIVVCKDNL